MPKKVDPKIEEMDDDAEVESVEIGWRGAVFTVPKDMDDWEQDARIATDKARRANSLELLKDALRLSLGDQQFAAMLALGSSKRDFVAFAAEFARVVNEECV